MRSIFSQVEGVVHFLYHFWEVRYTIFRATNSRDIPIRLWALGARPTPGYRMHKILRRMYNSRSQGGNGYLLARRQRLARGVELAGETQSARVAKMGIRVETKGISGTGSARVAPTSDLKALRIRFGATG